MKGDLPIILKSFQVQEAGQRDRRGGERCPFASNVLNATRLNRSLLTESGGQAVALQELTARLPITVPQTSDRSVKPRLAAEPLAALKLHSTSQRDRANLSWFYSLLFVTATVGLGLVKLIYRLPDQPNGRRSPAPECRGDMRNWSINWSLQSLIRGCGGTISAVLHGKNLWLRMQKGRPRLMRFIAGSAENQRSRRRGPEPPTSFKARQSEDELTERVHDNSRSPRRPSKCTVSSRFTTSGGKACVFNTYQYRLDKVATKASNSRANIVAVEATSWLCRIDDFEVRPVK